MTLPTTETTITYPDGATTPTGTVLNIEPLTDGRSVVLLHETGFHPVDTAQWIDTSDKWRLFRSAIWRARCSP